MKKILSRRSGVLTAILLLCVLTAVSLISCFSKEEKPEKTEKTMFLMDTYVTQTLYGDGCPEAEVLLKKTDRAFSLYNSESELYNINKKAGKEAAVVSDEMLELIDLARQYGENSRELFDVTIGSVTSLWNINDIENARVPSDSEISAALSLMGSENIEIDKNNKTVFLKTNGMKIDFGGIAKGYVCDKLKEVYEADSALSAAVASFGSSILLYGEKPDGKAYKVAIRNPDDGQSTVANLSLSECFVSTSGGYERYFEIDGVKYHHIFDPKTGKPSASDLSSVTVITSKGALGDFLSTAVFVGGKDSIDKLDYDFSVIAISGKTIYVSKALKDCFELTDDRFEVAFI